MKKDIFFCTVLSFFGAAAFASEWNNFTSVRSGDTEYFFDAESVNKAKDVVTLWVKTVRKNTPDANGSWATAFQQRVNCQKKTVQTLSWSLYDATGKFLESNSDGGQERSVVPDSVGEAIQKTVCLAAFPKSTPATKNSYFKILSNDVFLATKIFIESDKKLVDNAPK